MKSCIVLVIYFVVILLATSFVMEMVLKSVDLPQKVSSHKELADTDDSLTLDDMHLGEPTPGMVKIFNRLVKHADIDTPGLYLDTKNPRINAYAFYSNNIVVTGRLLKYSETVDRLSLVIGHEICHLKLNHHLRVHSKEVEKEADLCGFELAKAAGFNVSRAIEFWKQYSNDFGYAYFPNHPHPYHRYQYLSKRITTMESVK